MVRAEEPVRGVHDPARERSAECERAGLDPAAQVIGMIRFAR
jgi:hypothetical protein